MPELDETAVNGWIDSSSILNDPFISQNWLFRISYRVNDCNSLEAFNKNEGLSVDILQQDGVCIQSIHSVGRPDQTGATVTTDYSIRFYASVKGHSYQRHLYQINYKALTQR